MLGEAASSSGPLAGCGSLAAIAEGVELQHLLPQLAGETLHSLWALQRPALLSHLRSIGVERLTERQKLATAVVKARAACTAAPQPPPPATPPAAVPPPQPPPPPPPPSPPPAAQPPTAAQPPPESPSDDQLAALLSSLSLDVGCALRGALSARAAAAERRAHACDDRYMACPAGTSFADLAALQRPELLAALKARSA